MRIARLRNRAASTIRALHEDLPRTVAKMFPRGRINIKRLDGNVLLDILTHLTAQRWVYDNVWKTAQRECTSGSAHGRA